MIGTFIEGIRQTHVSACDGLYRQQLQLLALCALCQGFKVGHVIGPTLPIV